MVALQHSGSPGSEGGKKPFLNTDTYKHLSHLQPTPSTQKMRSGAREQKEPGTPAGAGYKEVSLYPTQSGWVILLHFFLIFI
jgi:hypothetical protein